MTPAAADIFDQFVEAIASRVAEKLAGEKPAALGRLMSIEDAATYLGKSKSAVRSDIAIGTIPASCVRRINRRVMLDRRELDKWLDAQ